MDCLDENTVAELFDGVLPTDDRARVEAHLDACASCRSLVAAVGSAHSGADFEVPRREVHRGASVGRYVVLEAVGAGSMGVVYLAYDPKLDRRVALKRLAIDDAAHADVRHRVLDEARSMARLSHPNVVAVHDVLDDAGVTYIAMEYVAGSTLAAWLEHNRGTQTVLEVFRQAGRGLAAAHAVGVIHRDFKPDNVLVSEDGRARVTDFGLAGLGTLSTTGRFASLDAEGTATLVGTPRYMAPELFAGAAGGPASDQFSFSYALYESLFDASPYAGDTADELLVEKSEGRIRVPRSPSVPFRVRRAVLKGLAADPLERHRDMTALLRELDPTSRTSWVGWGLGCGAALAAGLVAASQDSADDPCPAPAMSDVWNDDQRTSVARSLSSWPDAESWTTRIDEGLTEYTERWQAVHVDACQATHVRRTKSEAALASTMACLEDRRRDLRALVEVLSELSAEAGPAAIDAVRLLPTLEACVDATEPPLSDAVSPAFADARSRVRALTDAGDYARALPAARSLADDAKDESARARGEAALALAWLQANRGEPAAAESSLRTAIVEAERAGADGLRAEALTLSTFVIGYAQARPEDGEVIAEQADALLGRLEAGPILRARSWRYRGLTLQRQGAFDRAAAAQQSAVELLEASESTAHPEYLKALIDHGNALRTQRRLAQAEARYRKALTVQQAALGETHPHLANTLHGLGDVLADDGRAEEALPLYDEALTIHRRTFGEVHPYVAGDKLAIAQAYQSLGRHDDAVVYLQQALDFYETHAPDDAHRAIGLAALSQLQRTQGQNEAALDTVMGAIELRRRITPRHPDLAVALHNAGMDLLVLERPNDALPYFDDAVALARDVLGEDHTLAIVTLGGRGRALHRAGRHDEALDVLEDTVRRWDDASLEDAPYERFMARWTLAMTLDALGRSPARSRALVRHAMKELDQHGTRANDSERVEEARAWLAAREAAAQGGGSPSVPPASEGYRR